MTDPVIQTQGLTRYFGGKCALDSLTLSVPRGCVFAFVGRNGSGKSTTIRMLMGLLQATRGGARVLGYDCAILAPEARGRIGYLAEGHDLYNWMTVAQLEAFQAPFFPHWNKALFDAVIEHFGLSRSAKARHLSRGERAGLALALTLAPDPELLILDDPALGLDPLARRALLEAMVYVTRRDDRTIFFSSHLLADVERVADHIAILDQSVLRAACSVETFRRCVRQFVLQFPGRPPTLPEMPEILESFSAEREVRVTLANATQQTLSRLAELSAAPLREVPLSLEDAVISLLSRRKQRGFFLQEVAS
ncbi:MAG: ABC transporter ATP-binding protein [Phycisphaeraceae bacterium]